jgi:hypothetical protein
MLRVCYILHTHKETWSRFDYANNMVEKSLWLRRRWNLMSSVINRKIKFSGILDFYFAGFIHTFSQEEFGVAILNMQTSPKKERLKGNKKQGANKDGPLVGSAQPSSHAGLQVGPECAENPAHTC